MREKLIFHLTVTLLMVAMPIIRYRVDNKTPPLVGRYPVLNGKTA